MNKVVYPTYKEACYAVGLLEDDKEYIECIKDAAHWVTAEHLHEVFVTLLSQKKLTMPLSVWLQTWHLLARDVQFKRRQILKRPGEPSSLFDFEEVMNNNHNQEPPPQNDRPPMVRPNGQAPRTMEELCQSFINGRGGPIAPIPIQATDFGLRHHMIQQVQNTNSIHSFDDMMRKILSKYFSPSMVTKLRNEITKFEQKPHESLFEVWEHYKFSIDQCPNHNMLLVTKIDMFYNGLTLIHSDTINAAAGGTSMQKTPEECYELIENMTAHHNHWDTSAIQDETSRNIYFTSTTESPKCPGLGDFTQETAYATTVSDFQAYMKANDVVMKNMQTQMTSLTNSNLELKNMFGQFIKMNTASSSSTRSLPSNTVPNPQEDLKVITTRSGITLVGPSISPSSSSKEVDREPETITDQTLLRTRRALLDVYGEELTLRVNNEAITFKVVQTSKYSYNDVELINRFDVIDIACEEYVHEVLGFYDNSKSGYPTLISDPIISLSSPFPTPFGGGDFILEEIEACLTSESIPPGIDDINLNLKGDICLLEVLLNNDPSLSPLPPKEVMGPLTPVDLYLL
nr:reverse transcriptase domain-containing protein [Tanacetum cinerariifolium]